MSEGEKMMVRERRGGDGHTEREREREREDDARKLGGILMSERERRW